MINKVTIEMLEKVFSTQPNISKHTGISIPALVLYKRNGFIPLRVACYVVTMLNARGVAFAKADDVDWMRYNEKV
tara:strand:- start:297 stop:521 length:225 start_codon:yes stop_codon:yes gene_type:complete